LPWVGAWCMDGRRGRRSGEVTRLVRTAARQAFVPRAIKRSAVAAINGARNDWQPHRFLAQELRRRGVTTCLDIGANVGQFAIDVRSAGFRGLIVSYEPSPVVFASLSSRAARDGRWRVRQRAVALESGVQTLHVSANDGLSSSLLEVLPEAQAVAAGIHQVADVDVETVTWPRVFADDDLTPHTTFIKLDCQGLDVALLESLATGGIRPTGIQCEVALTPTYRGAGTLSQVVDVLQQLRLEPVDVRASMQNRKGQSVELDIVAFAHVS
jgi:FkbM family methyltransferase